MRTIKPQRNKRSSRRNYSTLVSTKCLSGSPSVVEWLFLPMFLDIWCYSPYFIPSASCPSDILVGFGLRFFFYNVKETVIPPSIGFSASWASRIKKKCMVSLGSARVYRADCYGKGIIECPPLESPALSWECVYPTKFLLFYLYKSIRAGDPSYF